MKPILMDRRTESRLELEDSEEERFRVGRRNVSGFNLDRERGGVQEISSNFLAVDWVTGNEGNLLPHLLQPRCFSQLALARSHERGRCQRVHLQVRKSRQPSDTNRVLAKAWS